MKHFFDTVANQNNELIQNASVTVYLAGTTTLAALYSNDTLTPLANPVFTNTKGIFSFYAADGKYDFLISGPSIATLTVHAVEVADVTEAGPGTGDAPWQTDNLEVAGLVTPPGTPPSGFMSIYSKQTPKHLFVKDDSGNETDLFTSVGSGSQPPLGSLQYDNAGSLGGSQFIYNPDDSTNELCAAPCVTLTVQGQNSSIQLASPSGDNFVGFDAQDGVFGANITTQSIVTDPGTNVQGQGSIAFIGGSTLGGSCFDGINNPSSPPCAQAYAAFPGDIGTETINSQDIVGFSSQPLLNKGPGQTVNTVASFVANTAVQQAPLGAFIPAVENTRNTYGLFVQDLGGFSTEDAAAIKIAPQTPQASGTLYGIEALPGSGINLLSDGIDLNNEPAPSLPNLGQIRLYADSGTGNLACLTPTGANCLPTGSGSSPAPPLNSLQKTGAGATLAPSSIVDNGTLVSVGEEIYFKGPNPYTDVRAYGVRNASPNVAPQIPGVTATINSGFATASLSTASSFQNGDGVVIFGAGPSNTVTTPTGLTITPSLIQAGAGTGRVVAAPAGSTQYCYTIIARDKPGGLSSAPVQVCTSTGASSLGIQNVGVAGFTRTGSTVTATTAVAHGLNPGAWVEIVTPNVNGTDNLYFGGNFNVATVPDATHFTYLTGQDVLNGAPTTSGAGGTAYWSTVNHLSWTSQPNAFEYYIYGRTNGSLAYIGTSRVQSTVNGLTPDTTFDDFGSPSMDGALPPFFVPLAPPALALAQPLVTTIVSGAGTSTLHLAQTASTSVAASTILFDNTPNIQTAASNTVFHSLLYFPGQQIVTNSYLTLPAGVSLNLAGTVLTLNDTMEIHAETKLFGMLGAQNGSALTFGYPVGAYITGNRANPAIYAGDATVLYFYGIQITANLNGGVGFLGDSCGNSSFNFLNFTSGGGSDVMTIPLIIRASDFLTSFDHIADIVGQNVAFFGVMPTPAFMYQGGNMVMSNLSFSGRGIFRNQAVAGPGIDIVINGASRIQGGTQPFFTDFVGNCCEGGSLTFNNVELDTMPFALYSQLGAGAIHNIVINNSGFASSGFGNTTGNPSLNFYSGNVSGQNNNAFSGRNFTNNAVFVTGNGEFMYPINNNVAPTAVVSAGGSVPVGSIPYAISIIDINGNESLLSPAVTAITSSGNQTVTLTPPAAPAGAVGWKPYRGGVLGNLNPYGGCSAILAFGTTYVDNVSFNCGASQPTVNRAGAQTLGASGLSGSAINLVGGGFKSAITGTFTANRTLVLPDANATVIQTPISFASLGTPTNGTFSYCPDCNIANPCTGGGTGALAKRLGGVWVCN